jgi:hypothetical protein
MSRTSMSARPRALPTQLRRRTAIVVGAAAAALPLLGGVASAAAPHPDARFAPPSHRSAHAAGAHLAATASTRGSQPAPGGQLADALRRLRGCESGGDYGAATGNGYYGAYQFDLGTWRSLGYGGVPSAASPATQDAAAATLHARRGWAPWPVCSRTVGLR